MKKRQHTIRSSITAFILAGPITALPSITAAEPILGFEIGTSIWHAETEGDIQSLAIADAGDGNTDGDGSGDGSGEGSGDGSSENSNGTLIPINSLNPKNDRAWEFFLAYRHQFPLIPQLKVRYARLQHDNLATLPNDVSFAGNSFTAGVELNSQTEMTWQDIELYYSLLNSWLELNLGVDINTYSQTNTLQSESTAIEPGDNTDVVTDTITASSVSVDKTTPLLLTQIALHLPETPLVFASKFHYYKKDETEISDLDGYIALDIDRQGGNFEAQFGYRTRKYIHQFDEMNIDLSNSGYYLSVSYGF